MPHVDNDYYAVLQVDSTASPDDIRNAFRRMILRHHPDLNAGHPTAAESTILLYEAYETLSDPTLRSDYDARLRQPGGEGDAKPMHRSRISKRVLTEPEPVVCLRCGHCDDTLRLSEFQMVTGLVWRTEHIDRNTGIYCSLCRFLLGTKWSLYCAIFGWWSITGPYWTLRALPRNLLGALAEPAVQKSVLLVLAHRLIWIRQLHDAERTVRRLIKIDPENPEIPGMLAEITLLLGERSPRKAPPLAARRLPPPAVSYLTVAVPVWLSVHYYPALVRSIDPPKPHHARTIPDLAASPAAPPPAPESSTGDTGFRWDFGDAATGGANMLSQTGQPNSGTGDTAPIADTQLLDDDTLPGYRMRDYDWTNRTSSEIIRPNAKSPLDSISDASPYRPATGDAPGGMTTVWGSTPSTGASGIYGQWGYESSPYAGDASTGR